MTSFDDLAPWTLFGEEAARHLRAIAWFQTGTELAQGSLGADVRQRLFELARDPYQPVLLPTAPACPTCGLGAAPEGHLLVPGEDVLYVASPLVTHLVEDHGYAPPGEFQAAVLACAEVGSLDYFQAFIASGGSALLRGRSAG